MRTRQSFICAQIPRKHIVYIYTNPLSRDWLKSLNDSLIGSLSTGRLHSSLCLQHLGFFGQIVAAAAKHSSD